MDYQQLVFYSSSEMATNGSFEPLQLTFSVVVYQSSQSPCHTLLWLASWSEEASPSKMLGRW
jgi:hypothetical protein